MTIRSAEPSNIMQLGGPFGQGHQAYRDAGFWPRPVYPGGKECLAKGWTKPDWEPSRRHLSDPRFGIGLLMGSPLPDGTVLGALDIDCDDYLPVAKMLLGGEPLCGRVGSKGAAFFVRVPEGTKSVAYKTKVGDGLFAAKLCVLPPTIHPNIGQAYYWIGTPLLDIDWSNP